MRFETFERLWFGARWLASEQGARPAIRATALIALLASGAASIAAHATRVEFEDQWIRGAQLKVQSPDMQRLRSLALIKGDDSVFLLEKARDRSRAHSPDEIWIPQSDYEKIASAATPELALALKAVGADPEKLARLAPQPRWTGCEAGSKEKSLPCQIRETDENLAQSFIFAIVWIMLAMMMLVVGREARKFGESPMAQRLMRWFAPGSTPYVWWREDHAALESSKAQRLWLRWGAARAKKRVHAKRL